MILCGRNGAYRRLDPSVNLLPRTVGAFVEQKAPLGGGGGWTVTDFNGFTLTQVDSIELHMNPLRGNGFGTVDVWFDNVHFY